MRSGVRAFAGCAALLAVAGSSHATTAVFEFTITNPTSRDWVAVRFDLRPSPGVTYTPDQPFSMVQFSEDMSDHDSTKFIESIGLLDAPTDQRLLFTFPAIEPLRNGDPEATFTITIENPEGLPYRVTWVPVVAPVPAPGALAAGGLCGFAAMRRRRPA
ncbi:MAG TPA: hypothetical protein VG797_03870 [Phycisphaerales bacterium]|nr:hypothetical protein [Phycisphaerales bacterium]